MGDITIKQALLLIDDLNELKDQLNTLTYINNHIKNKDCITLAIKHRDSELTIDLDLYANTEFCNNLTKITNLKQKEIELTILKTLK